MKTGKKQIIFFVLLLWGTGHSAQAAVRTIVNHEPRLFPSLVSPLNGLDEKILEKLLAESNLKIKSTTQCNADISFLAIDFKFDGENLKILEFCEGKNGGYRTFDAIFEKGNIWRGFWRYLKTLDLPIFYVGPIPPPHHVSINKIGVSLQEKLAWDDFLKVGGRAFNAFQDLERDGVFRSLLVNKRTDLKSLKSYKGVIIYKRRDDREPPLLRSFELFKKKYPHFLFLDEVSRPYAADKRLGNLLYQNDSELQKYRPKCKIYSKVFYDGIHEELAQAITRDFEGEQLVIKPANSGMSNGVLIIRKKNILNVLKKIIFPESIVTNSNNFNHRPVDTVTYGYWQGDKNKSFIVEEFVTSKLICINNKDYDPSLRAVFVLTHDRGLINLHFLECWWKLPMYSLTDKCNLTERYVSKYRPDLKQLPIEKLTVNQQDLTKIQTLLQDALPKLYTKMLKVHKTLLESI